MSFNQKFAAAALAATVLSTSAVSAQNFQSAPAQPALPPEVLELIGNVNLDLNVRVDMENGQTKSINYDVIVTDLNCTALKPFYDMYKPTEADKALMLPEEVKMADFVEEVFANGTASIQEDFGLSSIPPEVLMNAPIEMLLFYPENAEMNVSVTCAADYTPS